MGLDMYLYAEEYVSGYDFTTTLKPIAPDDSALSKLSTALEAGGMSGSLVASEPAPPENVTRYRSLRDLSGLADMADPHTPSLTVSVTVAYWRKANQIHAWFVDHCQDGVDECQRSYVSREKLVELRDLAADVARRQRSGEFDAWQELPPRNGFFFGSTEIDSYYLDDLDDTVRQLDRVLNHPKSTEVDFYYQSSW